MNWDAIGTVAEVLGAAGVIATLVYLSIQIRNAADVDRANIRANLTEGSQKALALGVEYPEIFIKAASGETLTVEQRFRLFMVHRIVFRGYENYAYQYSLGLFDESEWRGVINAIEGVLSEPYAQEDWRAVRHQYSEAAQKLLDPLVPDLTDKSKVPEQIYTRNVQNSNSAT